MLLVFSSLAYGVEPFDGFLTKHCVRCHGPKKEKGDLRIDTLSRDFKAGIDSHLWAEVNERINAGEMPPEEEPSPNEKEISEFIAQLGSKIKPRESRPHGRPPRPCTLSSES